MMHICTKTNRILSNTPLNNVVQRSKCSSANEQDIFRVNLHCFLVRVFTSSLWWNVRDSALNNFQQCLLNTFPGNIPCNRDVFTFSGNFVNFINIDNALLRALYVIIRRLQEFQHNVFYVFTNISCLCQRCRISYRKRHIKYSGKSLCQQSLTCSCRTD